LFLQTMFQPNLYGVTWSLVAEEGFYLLLPFTILGFALVGRRRVTVVCLVIALLIPITGRAIGLQTIDAFTLKQIPQVRFDGLVVGASLAALWTQPKWKAWIMQQRYALFAVGGAGFVLLYAIAPDGLLFFTFGLLGVSLCVGLTIPQMTLVRWPAFVPAVLPILVTFLSDLTYPLYLFHPLGYQLTDLLGIHGRAGYFAVSLSLILAGAIIIHLGVERPFLALRTRVGTVGRLAYAAEPMPVAQVAAAV
jgi:peptidoglycan/LPS O-acetylase OafA/YrhL